MHTVSLLFRGGQRQVNLVFDDEAKARVEYCRYVGPISPGGDVVAHTDDYGTTIAVLFSGPLEAVILQDAARAQEANLVLSLMQADTQKRFQLKAGGGIVPGRGVILNG